LFLASVADFLPMEKLNPAAVLQHDSAAPSQSKRDLPQDYGDL
jgi:hypothetical protein